MRLPNGHHRAAYGQYRPIDILIVLTKSGFEDRGFRFFRGFRNYPMEYRWESEFLAKPQSSQSETECGPEPNPFFAIGYQDVFPCVPTTEKELFRIG